MMTAEVPEALAKAPLSPSLASQLGPREDTRKLWRFEQCRLQVEGPRDFGRRGAATLAHARTEDAFDAFARGASSLTASAAYQRDPIDP